jgi:hypothetical protein
VRFLERGLQDVAEFGQPEQFAALTKRNEFVLGDVRDNAKNSMARVAVVRALDQLSDGAEARTSPQVRSPDIVVQIVNYAPPAPLVDDRIIEISPTIDVGAE